MAAKEGNMNSFSMQWWCVSLYWFTLLIYIFREFAAQIPDALSRHQPYLRPLTSWTIVWSVSMHVGAKLTWVNEPILGTLILIYYGLFLSIHIKRNCIVSIHATFKKDTAWLLNMMPRITHVYSVVMYV